MRVSDRPKRSGAAADGDAEVVHKHGPELRPARRELARLRQAAVAALRERFDRAVREGDLPEGSNRVTGTLRRHDPERAGGPVGERGNRDGTAGGRGAAMRVWPA